MKSNRSWFSHELSIVALVGACLLGIASAPRGANVRDLDASEGDRSAAPAPHAASEESVAAGFEAFPAPPVALAGGISGTGAPPEDKFGAYLHPVVDHDGKAFRGAPPTGAMGGYVPPASASYRP